MADHRPENMVSGRPHVLLRRFFRSKGLPSRESGFTLLEVMAAVAILWTGIVMVIELFSGGLGLVKKTDGYTRNVLVAREKMAETLLAEKLEEGTQRGVTGDGVSWTVEVSPYEPKGADDNANASIFKVVVSAEGSGKRKNTFTLTTLKTVFLKGPQGA